MSENAETGFADALRRRIDPPVAIAFACIIVMLLLGSLYSRSFLSPEYLLQQLKVASFLGVIATGTMIVILLGQIDLSIPWVVAVGGMMSTAATGWSVPTSCEAAMRHARAVPSVRAAPNASTSTRPSLDTGTEIQPLRPECVGSAAGRTSEERPIREEYLIVDGGKLAGAGAHSYSAGDATKGSEDAAKFKRAD